MMQIPAFPTYKERYFELVQKITQQLGPHLGALKGPHPQICATCNGGPCQNITVCGAEFLWIDTPEDLLWLASEQLGRLRQLEK